MRRKILGSLRPCLWLLLPLIGLILYKIAFGHPAQVEQIYSRGIYPLMSKILGGMTGWIPFSLGEVLLYAALLWLIGWLVYSFLAFRKPGKEKILSFLRRIVWVLVVPGLVLSVFLYGWAFNYARMPLASRMDVQVQDSTKEELYTACHTLMEEANALRDQVEEDENGVFRLRQGKEAHLSCPADLYASYAPPGVHTGVRANVKAPFTKNFLSVLQTSGIYSFYTFEANVNMEMPDLYFPVTVCHEYAHLEGYAREDEANFLGWYTARESQDVDVRYSAAAFALVYATNSLYGTDRDLHRQLMEEIHPGILRDWQDHSRYWDAFESELADKANQNYDNYLKANGVEDGSKSYGRFVDLILALQRAGRLTVGEELSTK